MVSSRPGSIPPCSIEIAHHECGVIVTHLAGHAHATLAMKLRNSLFLGPVIIKGSDLIVNATELAKFDADFERPFVELMKDFVAFGGKRVLFVAKRHNIRLMAELLNASSIAADGPRIETFDTSAQAFREVDNSQNGETWTNENSV